MESLCLAGEMCFDPSSSNGPMARSAWLFMAAHSSEIRGLHLTKFTSEIVYYKKTNVVFLFLFFAFHATLLFSVINALFYVNTDQVIHKGKSRIAQNKKGRKTPCTSLEYLIERRPLIF